jgi:hypothetical protein
MHFVIYESICAEKPSRTPYHALPENMAALHWYIPLFYYCYLPLFNKNSVCSSDGMKRYILYGLLKLFKFATT